MFQGERGEEVILFFGLIAILRPKALSYSSCSYNDMFPIKPHHETTVVGKLNFCSWKALFYSLRSGRVCLAAMYRGLVLVHIFSCVLFV